MTIATFKGVATIACPTDAPAGTRGFVFDRDDNLHWVRLVALIGATHATVADLATGRTWRVRRESFRVEVVRA